LQNLDVKSALEHNGLKKAATLMFGLGTQVSAQIFRELGDKEREFLVLAMSNIGTVKSEQITAVTKEFSEMIMAQNFITQRGADYAKEVLSEAFGPDYASKIVERVGRRSSILGLHDISEVDIDQLMGLLKDEHPQTVAFILSQIDTSFAGDIISKLDENLSDDIIARIAQMDKIETGLVSDVEEALSSTMNLKVRHSQVGGVDKTADILNHVGRVVEKRALQAISAQDPVLAEEIEKRMFVFDLILRLDDQDIQKLLREVDNKELAVSLKVTKPEMMDKVMKNLSERAQEMLQEEIEYLGKIRLREVEEAQQKIAMKIKELSEADEIQIPTGAEEEVYV